MQHGYAYRVSEPAGRNFHADFRPDLTPKQMLALGVNRDVAQALYHWYQNSASGGLDTRQNRIELLKKIIGLF